MGRTGGLITPEIPHVYQRKPPCGAQQRDWASTLLQLTPCTERGRAGQEALAQAGRCARNPLPSVHQLPRTGTQVCFPRSSNCLEIVAFFSQKCKGLAASTSQSRSEHSLCVHRSLPVFLSAAQAKRLQPPTAYRNLSDPHTSTPQQSFQDSLILQTGIFHRTSFTPHLRLQSHSPSF